MKRPLAMGVFLLIAWSTAHANPAATPDRGTRFERASAWQSGDQFWANEFSLPRVDGVVRCAIEYGGQLVVGGAFTRIGDVPARNLALWNGSSWSEFGGGANGSVGAAILYQGDLVIGGEFNSVGGEPAMGVARWRGDRWEAFGLGLGGGYAYPGDSPVSALAVYQGALVVAGDFTRTGPFQLPYLARWDGSAWLPMASWIDGPVHALQVSGDTLIVGGAFTHIDYRSMPAVARWDGTGWSPMGAGLGGVNGYGDVRALLPFQGRIVAGGYIGDYDSRLALWDGSSWEPVSPFYSAVLSLAAREDTLFVGSDQGVTSWTGLPDTTYVPEPGVGGPVYTLAWFGPDLVAAGDVHVTAPDGTLLARSIAIRRAGGWSGTIPATSHMHGLDGYSSRVLGLETYRDQLLAVGYFDYVGNPPGWKRLHSLASWDGTSWNALPELSVPGLCGYGIRGPLLARDDTLYVAGHFAFCQGTYRNVPVMRLDGTGWSPLDTLDLEVNAMTWYEGKLHIAGDRRGSPFRGEVYRWDEGRWTRIGFTGGYSGSTIRTMTVHDGRLIVGGVFEGMNNRFAVSIAAWDGSAWAPVGALGIFQYGGVPYVQELGVHRGLLMATVGSYYYFYASVLQWNGSKWEALGSLSAEEATLASVGGELYVAGRLRWDRAEQFREDGIARWNGRTWEPLGSGTNAPVLALKEWKRSLFAGGYFTRAGTHTSFGIARWDGLKATLGAPRVSLAPGTPNPFRVDTTIRYRLEAEGDIHVSISDVRGRRVKILEWSWQGAGDHTVSWDGRDGNGRPAASGVYYVTILYLDATKTSHAQTSQKLVLLR